MINKQNRLAKKYPSLKIDLAELFESLETNPSQGTALGNNFFKIRLAISAKGKGKSGGARVITYLRIVETTVYLSSIYEKGDKDSISTKELERIFKMIP